MNGLHSQLFYALVMLATGLGIPVMAALNGSLGTKLQNPALATSILFLVGGTLSLCYLFLTSGIPKIQTDTPIPIYYFFGGFFVIFYILSITWIAPKFGVGNAVSFVLLGQILSMAIIDHFGLLGAPYNPINVRRLIGLALMIVGVFLAVRRV